MFRVYCFKGIYTGTPYLYRESGAETALCGGSRQVHIWQHGLAGGQMSMWAIRADGTKPKHQMPALFAVYEIARIP